MLRYGGQKLGIDDPSKEPHHSSMEDDVAKALAYQVKRELAERYFGLRKLIEEDTGNYFKKIEEIKKKHLPPLKKSWHRIYILLVGKELIQEFVALLGLSFPPFYEEYQNVRDPFALLEGLPVKGWTFRGRYKNLVFSAYEQLKKETEKYRKVFQQTKAEAEIINHEIELFKEKYDLNEIMQFLKSLEAPSGMADLGHTSLEESVSTLEKTLAFEKIPGPENFLPEMPKVPSLKEIKPELEKIVIKIVKRYPEEAKRILEHVKSHSQS